MIALFCLFAVLRAFDCRLSAEGGRVPEEPVLQAEPRPRSRALLPYRTAVVLWGASALQQAGVDPPFLPHHLQVCDEAQWSDDVLVLGSSYWG